MTKEQLHKIRDEKEAELRSADAIVIGTARSIANDHKQGREPSRFVLELLCSAVANQERVLKEAIAAGDAVVKAPDEAVS